MWLAGSSDIILKIDSQRMIQTSFGSNSPNGFWGDNKFTKKQKTDDKSSYSPFGLGGLKVNNDRGTGHQRMSRDTKSSLCLWSWWADRERKGKHCFCHRECNLPVLELGVVRYISVVMTDKTVSSFGLKQQED